MTKKKNKEEKVTEEEKVTKEEKVTTKAAKEEKITDEVTEEKIVEEIIDAVKEKTPQEIILELEGKIKELQNALLREKADLENIRKRLEKERIMERKYAAMSICKNLLTPLDHFGLALKHETNDKESEKTFEGFKMIKEQLNKALEGEGVSNIDALDEEYDPNYHQAILTEKVEGKEANVVLEVLQEGYMFKDRIIRPAIVKISE
ncbi:MAG: nucleotide exchange factor GrpE [Candidatus Izimaplasma sp.]|nr:nucleotide exchange factor GrpE [Candidatus Izimaplasma bacterium]